MTKRFINPEPIDPAFRGLFKLGGVAAWIAAALILGEAIAFAFYPQPGPISDWFMLFQRNPLLGLLDFWVLELPMYATFALVFLALYFLLRKVDAGWMAIALTLALLGMGVFFATNNPFAMLSVSNQYATATTDADRTMFLAAGQSLLANTNQRAIGGFNMGLFLVSIASLIISLVMLQSHTFSKSTAIFGILANAFSLADYLRQVLTSSPMIALLVILPNTIFLIIWYIMIGRRLYQLGRRVEKTGLRQLWSKVAVKWSR
jgi:hypothetical protein